MSCQHRNSIEITFLCGVDDFNWHMFVRMRLQCLFVALISSRLRAEYLSSMGYNVVLMPLINYIGCTLFLLVCCSKNRTDNFARRHT